MFTLVHYRFFLIDEKLVVVLHIYPPFTGQRQKQTIGRSVQFLLH